MQLYLSVVVVTLGSNVGVPQRGGHPNLVRWCTIIPGALCPQHARAGYSTMARMPSARFVSGTARRASPVQGRRLTGAWLIALAVVVSSITCVTKPAAASAVHGTPLSVGYRHFPAPEQPARSLARDAEAIRVVHAALQLWAISLAPTRRVVLADPSELESPLPNTEGPARDPPYASTPIVKISYDAQGRVAWVKARIDRDPDQGDDPTRAMRSYVANEGRPSDNTGHIVGKRLGGKAAAEWQVFPQRATINSGTFSQFEGCVYTNALQEPIDYYLRFKYPMQGQSKRPVSFEAAFVRTVQNLKVWTGERFKN